MSARLAACLLLAVGSAGAQSTLADETLVVATGKGLFVVHPGQPAVQLFDTTPFGGGTLAAPSVTWIDGTDAFLVTRRDLSGAGGLWRVELLPGGGGSVTDLTPAIPAALGRDFVDSDYSVGLDTLFVLERRTGQVIAALHPATTTAAAGAGFAHWADVPPESGVSLAVRGAKHPFSVLVVQATGEVLSVDKSGATFLNQNSNPSWTQVATEPLGGSYYLASEPLDKVVVGKKDLASGLSQVLIDLNTYNFGGGFCGPLAQAPLDIAYDLRSQRVVALAGDFVPDCAFDGVATGKSHIIRLPVAAAGPPGSEPALLTAAGDSGVLGAHGDLALVRHDLPDVTWYGQSGSGAGTSAPLFGDNDSIAALAVGETTVETLGGAPPQAAAALVLGIIPLNAPLQGQLLGPLPQRMLPAFTGVGGAAQIALTVPPISALVGLRVYAQWWIDDTTTPGSGDLASSQVGILTIGTP